MTTHQANSKDLIISINQILQLPNMPMLISISIITISISMVRTNSMIEIFHLNFISKSSLRSLSIILITSILVNKSTKPHLMMRNRMPTQIESIKD
jgi:hypothetical protein